MGTERAPSSVVVIVGPTAAGKTALSVALAEMLGGEIVSADSRQIYRGMDIGTAKAAPDERGCVPHHLLDIVNPDQILTLAEYQRMAYAAIGEIAGRCRLPFLVGRRASVRTMELAVKVGDHLVMLTQRDPKEEEPKQESLFPTGTLALVDTVSRNNVGGSWYTYLPGISMLDGTRYQVVNSTVQ